MTEDDVDDVVALAVDEADPADVLPPDEDPDPGTWTASRRRAYAAFLRSRLAPLPDGRREASFLVVADGRTVGVARALPTAGEEARGIGAPSTSRGAVPAGGTSAAAGGPEHEIGLWIARGARGRGLAAAVVEVLVDHVRRCGGTALVADTTEDNRAARSVLRRAGARPRSPGADPSAVRVRIDL